MPQSYEYSPPRPYLWKTDELPTNSEARKTLGGDDALTHVRLQMPNAIDYGSTIIATEGMSFLDPNYRCPHCGSQFLPKTERRVSTGGWITFAVLLATVFPLFWIGLLIKADVNVCPSCSTPLGKPV